MSGLQTFATFGLPALAFGGAMIALWAARRGAARIDRLESDRRKGRAFGN